MHLLDTTTLELAEFYDSNTPPYAILSHTWGDEEITFQDMQESSERIRSKSGYIKIVKFCSRARHHGFQYAWVDTVCIDKRSSAELTEAINSMYRFYFDAAICLIYLADVPRIVEDAPSRRAKYRPVKQSRWFSRGWTLQELIAPITREFLAEDWSTIEDDGSGHLLTLISEVTGISATLLQDRSQLSKYPVSAKMSWASRRQTTRSEDVAYSLMGLFNVSMPVLYGEGSTRAFKRLQNEIMQTSFDQTIFAWRGDYASSGLLAKSPSDFRNTPPLELWSPSSLSPFSMTNLGLYIRMTIVKHVKTDSKANGLEDEPGSGYHHALIHAMPAFASSWEPLLIYLQPVPPTSFVVNGRICTAYRRVKCSEWTYFSDGVLEDQEYADILVLEDEHLDLMERTTFISVER